MSTLMTRFHIKGADVLSIKSVSPRSSMHQYSELVNAFTIGIMTTIKDEMYSSVPNVISQFLLFHIFVLDLVEEFPVYIYFVWLKPVILQYRTSGHLYLYFYTCFIHICSTPFKHKSLQFIGDPNTPGVLLECARLKQLIIVII